MHIDVILTYFLHKVQCTVACRYNVQLLYLIFYSRLQLTLKPVYLMIVVIISCIAFIFLDLCFNNIEAATTTQDSHFSMDKSISCFSLLKGIATAIKNKYNHGERNFNSELIFSRDKPFMSEADVFLKSEGFLVETIEQHSLDISFKQSLKNSVFKGATLKAALAISFQLPCTSDRLSGKSWGSKTRCFVCDGQEITTYDARWNKNKIQVY